jgi:hypothetical protein
MATAQDLANATAIPPPAGGGNCHEAVFALLVAAGSVTQAQVDRLSLWRGGYTNLAGRVLAQRNDPRIISQMDVLRLNAPGLIVGFYYPTLLLGIAYSMVTRGGALIAGRNNLNVGGGIAYQNNIRIQNLPWHLDNHGCHVVGPQSYHVHIATVDQFEVRFAQESAAWVLVHPHGF